MNIEQYRAMVAQQESEKEKSAEQPKVEETDAEVNETQNNESKEAKATEEETQPKQEEQESTPSTKVKVGEEEVEIDELIKGYMRQSDYTKKTQEVSTRRKELEEAISVYEKIKSDPELKKAVEEGGDIISDEKKLELEEAKASIELEKNIVNLMRKYPDFDEVAVINEAARLGVSDLEFVHNALTAQNNKQNVDMDTLRAELKKELLAELEANKDVPTIISSNGGQAPKESDKPTLTPAEKKVARALGVSEKDYLANK